MTRGPLQRLTDEEIDYLKHHLRRDIREERELQKVFGDNHELYKWLERRILITADHFKLRYQKDE